MNEIQRAFILEKMIAIPSPQRVELVNDQIDFFGLSNQDKVAAISDLFENFNQGLGLLTEKQFVALKEKLKNGANLDSLRRLLIFFDINEAGQEVILNYFKALKNANSEVDVIAIDEDFSGIQVVTDGDFNKILQQGWTGEWIIDFDRFTQSKIKRIQIASMREDGPYPRGFYINADIVSVSPTPHEEGRYRFVFENAQIFNSGNRNVKFSQNPVRYIG
jgi:hypothetical protein